MEQLSLLVWRLRAIQAFSEDFERRYRRGERVTVTVLTLSGEEHTTFGWIKEAVRCVVEGLRFLFTAACDRHHGRAAPQGGRLGERCVSAYVSTASVGEAQRRISHVTAHQFRSSELQR